MDDRELVARAEGLVEEVESLADPAARDKALELVQALLDLYGEGLARMVGAVAERDDGTLAASLSADELVSHLLLLHGLHPEPVEVRVGRALAEVRPYLESHGGDVELLGVEDGVARLRLRGSCSGCPSSTVTLKLAIEDAIRKAAPDLDEILAEDAEAPAPAPVSGLTVRAVDGAWAMAGGLPELSGGGPLVKGVSGEPVLFLRLEGRFYAYRPACPGCDESLDGAALIGVTLTCPACGHSYDVMRAGRCLDAPHLHLEPVPLLVDDAGLVKVALAAPA
jgi:Fe-S cluster biogenesis protein NfuA/nitrite reductase/ring-hydroxylating ferredoxin subunit